MSSSTRPVPEQQHPHLMVPMEKNSDRDVSGPLVVTPEPAFSPSNQEFNLDFSTLENSNVGDSDFDSFLALAEVKDVLRDGSGKSASELSLSVKEHSALERSDSEPEREAFAELRAKYEQEEWNESVVLLLEKGNGWSLNEVQRLMDKAVKLNIPEADPFLQALQGPAKLQRAPATNPTFPKSTAQSSLATSTPELSASNDVEDPVDISSSVQASVNQSAKLYEWHNGGWYDHGTGIYIGNKMMLGRKHKVSQENNVVTHPCSVQRYFRDFH